MSRNHKGLGCVTIDAVSRSRYLLTPRAAFLAVSSTGRPDLIFAGVRLPKFVPVPPRSRGRRVTDGP
jgi:hypothetical protein